MIEYFTVALLSIMIFYSFGIAFNVHRTLDKENAGKLLRKLFPLYFLWGIIISILAEIILLYQGLSLKALFMAIVAIGFLYSTELPKYLSKASHILIAFDFNFWLSLVR